MDYGQLIRKYIELEKKTLDALNIDEIAEAMNAIWIACEKGGTIYVLGNGGSAATASHFICDFAKGAYEATGKHFNMVCLSDNTPIVTAIANDISYSDVFVFQLKDMLEPDDLLLAISGSGSSENVIRAAEYANSCGIKVIGVTGYDGGKLRKLADFHMHVPVDNMQIAEDIHMIFDHMTLSVFRELYK